MPPTLLALPHEILHCIIIETDPQDIARLCCCHTLNNYIRNNRQLFKDLYLNHFDEPSLASDQAFAWENELPQLVRFQKILRSNDINKKRSELEIVSSSVDHLLATAAPGSRTARNIQYLSMLFQSPSNVQGLMCSSLLFDLAKAETLNKRPRRTRAASDSESRSTARGQDSKNSAGDESHETAVYPKFLKEGSEMRTRQLSAKLHVLYGIPIQYARDFSGNSPRYDLRSELKARSTHPYARSLVYDLRRYTDGTFFGPFLDDHSQDADWEKLEAIMIVMNYNIKKYVETYDPDETMVPRWNKPFAGASPSSFVSPPFPIPKEPKLPLAAQDPYNVTGTWMRVVCFLDYNDLFGFNFLTTTPRDQPRHPLENEEAFRLIIMKLEITKIEPPGEEESQGLPVVRFKGTSAAVRPPWDPNSVSKIKGLVRLTPQGEVRWTSWSIFHGEERYRSEGIQIGGPQSARGVLGTWFDRDYDEHGPAGPTCFWKTTDELKDIKPFDENF